MFTSAIKYWVFSLVTAVFGLTYEHFSHGVVSYFMVLAFLVPLLGGAAQLFPALRRPRGTDLWRKCGILTLTVGCILRGILDIYGTTNRLCAVYWLLGAGFLALDLLSKRVPERCKKEPGTPPLGGTPGSSQRIF